MRIWLLLLAALSLSLPAQAADSDLDGVDDLVDNCPFVANPRVIPALPGQTTVGGQPDDDLDGTGNACDCDFTGDGFCNVDDFNGFIADFISGVPGAGSGTDMTGDGFVNIDDFLRFVVGFQSGFPGPSCGPACDALELGCSGPECPAGPNAACASAADALCVDRDFVAADDLLANCLAGLNVDDPGVPPAGSGLTFGAATGFRGLTRALRPFFEQPDDGDPSATDSIREVLDALGFSELGRDPLDWMATRSTLADSCVVDGGLDPGDFQRALELELLPALDQSLAELGALEAQLPQWDGACDVPTTLGSMRIEFDETDALALRALLHSFRGLLRWLLAYDVESDLELACETLQLGPLGGIEQLLVDRPGLLEFRDDDLRAAPALDDFLWAAALSRAAFDSWKAETDDQGDDLFSLAFESNEDEQALRERLQRLENTLLGPTQFPNLGLCGDPPLDVGAFFETAPRALLPPFQGNQADGSLFPDFTFGQTIPGFTAEHATCSFEAERPTVAIGTSDGFSAVGFDFVDIEVRAVDEPANGSGIDIASFEFWLQPFQCDYAVEGVPVPVGSIGGVGHLFSPSTASDGATIFSARLTADGASWCGAAGSTRIVDRNGNQAFRGASFIAVVNDDLLLRISPPGSIFSLELAPLELALEIRSRDSAVLDPDDQTVTLFAPCPEGTTLNGQPANASPFEIPVTTLFQEDGDPSDEVRTLSATVDLGASEYACIMHFCVDPVGVGGPFPRVCAPPLRVAR